MALIQFGKKEIEVLEKANQKLIQELEKEKALGEKFNTLLISKEKEIDELKQQLREIEKVKIDNQKLEKIINIYNQNSKATLENVDTIRELKKEGHSFRSIAKVLSEATGTSFVHSTVCYLYNKYIK